MQQNKTIKYLRSSKFAVLIAILSVLVQSFHSFKAFYDTSSLRDSLWGISQAVLFAIVVDMAILFYTLRKRTDIARYAAVAMVMINCYYYYVTWGFTLEFWFGCFLSLIIPVSVYFYSEELPLEETSEEDVKKIIEENVRLNSDLERFRQDFKNGYSGNFGNGAVDKTLLNVSDAD
jgi:acyl-CoA synthetase (AMP-forming)/AMP-acid ligase II